MNDKLAPIHPGEVLLEEFLVPMGISQNQLALAMDESGAQIEHEVIQRVA